MFNYHLVASEITHGECEYGHLYLIKVEGELPDDVDHQLTSWNWDAWEEDDPDLYSGCLDLGVREVRDYVKKPVSEEDYLVLRKYLNTISFDFKEK